jgi:putative endonuclease
MGRSLRPDPHGGQAGRRRQAERRGHLSEYLAALYLLLKGYRILALRYRTRLGEVDIVARKGDILAFVEVKARRDAQAGLDAVGGESQRRIRAASDIWLAKYGGNGTFSQRYDVLVITPRRWPRHFPDAF